MAQFRPCQGGIGSTGLMVATSAGSTTVGVRLRLCTDADGMPTFCPFSSNLIGGPMMMWSAMFVSRIAFMSSGPFADPDRLKASAATSKASKVKPT